MGTAHPIIAIVEIVTTVDPTLDTNTVEHAVRQATPNSGQQRQLASALRDNPDLLTNERPVGPPTIERLVRELQPFSGILRPPRCAQCDEPKPLKCLNSDALRICASCANSKRAVKGECTACGVRRRIVFQDRHGHPLCRQCPPEADVDHTAEIRQHILSIDPNQRLEKLNELIEQAIPHASQRRAVAWELERNPDLLTGAGFNGSRRVVVLIELLVGAQVDNVVQPPCPFCGRVKPLKGRRDGLACCSRCYATERKRPCSSCGKVHEIAARNDDGQPLCPNCAWRLPENYDTCDGCGRHAPIRRRGADQSLCNTCSRGRWATCAFCGEHKRCSYADTELPRCDRCTAHLLHRDNCSSCGVHRLVAARTESGLPLCSTCRREREECSRCRRQKYVAARLAEGPLCANCYAKDAASFQACHGCGKVERLHHYGLCADCACPKVLRPLLAGANGEVRPEMEPVYQALLGNDRARLLEWLGRSTVATRLLAALASREGPITHQVIDDLGPYRKSQRIRAILVTGGVLEPRDELLVHVERSIARAGEQVADPTERKALNSFATWTHLRRLRKAAESAPLLPGQVHFVQHQLNRAVELLSWLEDQDKSLATCTQSDLDVWLTDSRKGVRSFVHWSVARGYAHDLTVPNRVIRAQRSVLGNPDQRWNLVQRLLNDQTIGTIERVAGLLVLLYAQPVSRICTLRIDQVVHTGSRVALTLGREPLELIAPVGELVLQLVQTRKGRAVLGHTDDHPWLFSGGPGQPIRPETLGNRLRAVGVPPRLSRNTALMDLAADLPAPVLHRLLGASVRRATSWNQEAGNIRQTYAAELARRNARRHP